MKGSRSLTAAVAVLALAACSGEPPALVAPADVPQLGVVGGNGGLDSGLTAATVRWTDGSLERFVYYSEGFEGGQRTTQLNYGLAWVYPCWWDPTQLCRDYVSFGGGVVPARDIRGGPADLTIETNTAPDANPNFYHYSDPGGWVRISVHAVPGAPGRTQNVSRFEWENLVIVTNSASLFRDGTATGDLLGVVIPGSAEASLVRMNGHSMVIERP